MVPVTGWVEPEPTHFEAKLRTLYQQALEFDGIAPGTRPELVVFSKDNHFAEKYRRMLH